MYVCMCVFVSVCMLYVYIREIMERQVKGRSWR